ncbi:MAG: ATP-dependent zinc metalloprotease FtsH [Planctomycetota bacterium]|nr:ATP-dependent zinc metalloprotease FtsH [Planctomycetota bacterium]
MSSDHRESRRGDGPPPRKDGEGSSQRGKPRGLLLVGVFLAIIVAIAAIANTSLGGRSETNLYEASRLLLDNRLDPQSFLFIKDKQIFQAAVREPRRPDEPERIAVHFVTEDEVDRFRKETLEKFNAQQGASFDWKVKDTSFWQIIIQPLIWVLLILLLYYLFMRQLRSAGAGGNLFSFGRSRAKLVSRETTGVTFADVAGVPEAKQEVQELIEFLRDPKRFEKLGGRLPRGVILVGSPGTGKTLLAKAIAGEADVPFFSICGSDFVEMFVGVGAARVRDLFRQAKDSSPCIVFLDEVDAVGRRRGTGLGGGHDEREQTLNAILVEMDGFHSHDGVIIIAATNRPDVLDPALLRPGRFDREIMMDLPDVKGRQEILKVHVQKIKMDSSVDLERIARATPGFSGAELAAVVNEAAIIATMNDQEEVQEKDLEEARDKLRWGRSKKSRVLDDEDRRITAYHEAGHALIADLLPEVEPLHKVTIIPRGMALGSTMQLPEKDRYHLSRKRILGELTLLYAGRVAEEMFCDDVTSGAMNDIERATGLARRMTCDWGMSDAIGPISFSEGEETLFLGREVTRRRGHSEDVLRKIDEEIHRVVQEAYQRCQKLLRKYRDAVERIAMALLERETLTGEEVAALVEGKVVEALGDPARQG